MSLEDLEHDAQDQCKPVHHQDLQQRQAQHGQPRQLAAVPLAVRNVQLEGDHLVGREHERMQDVAVEVVPCVQPAHHKAGKESVAYPTCHSQILDRFRELGCSCLLICCSKRTLFEPGEHNKRSKKSYSKDNVRKIHDNKDGVTSPPKVGQRTSTDQEQGHGVVGDHGPKVLARCFDIEDKDLLEPEGKLDVVVPDHDMGQAGEGVVLKEGFGLEPEPPVVPHGRAPQDVLNDGNARGFRIEN